MPLALTAQLYTTIYICFTYCTPTLVDHTVLSLFTVPPSVPLSCVGNFFLSFDSTRFAWCLAMVWPYE